MVFLCISACTNQAGQNITDERKDQPLKIATNNSTSQNKTLTNSLIAKQSKEMILNYKEINEVIAIHFDKQLFVGFNVKKFQEFNVVKIEKRVHKDLKKTFPQVDLIVSHDRKILIELEKLANNEGNLSDRELKKRLRKIKELSKEKT